MADTPQIPLDDLGFDAKVLAAAWFGMGMKATITLHLRESRPAPRTRAAIDELVARGVASEEPFNEFGGLVLKPLVDCSPAFRWMAGFMHDDAQAETAALARWTLTEPIDEEGAYALMTPFGQGVWDKERRGRTLRQNPYDATTQADEHQRWRKGHRAGARA